MKHNPGMPGATVAAAAVVGAATAATRRRRVAVVGGGSAGVVTARFLAEAGHEPVVFEKGRELGGIWAPLPTNDVVYPNLVTNIPKAIMQSFDLEFSANLPSYIEAADLGQYIVAYAEHFNIRRFVRFNTEVSFVRALRSEQQESDGDSAWCVGSRDSGGAHVEEEFDAVVVASGHYSAPYMPEVPGQAEWLATAAETDARTVRHSQSYSGPDAYIGRVVLVVGGRSSAVDVSRELRGSARWTYVLDKGCSELRTVDTCVHVPFGAELSPDGRLLLDAEGVPGPPVDDVVLATGYKYDFPFLDANELKLDYGPVDRYLRPLYMHVAHALRPSLCFVGIPLAVPCPIPLFEAQARFAVSNFTSTGPFEERLAWVEARMAAVGERPQDMHFLSDGAWDYMLELMRLAGVEGEEMEVYSQRLAVVRAIYQDRGKRRPLMPWDSDWYRRCEYEVDWAALTWRVSLPEDAPAGSSAL